MTLTESIIVAADLAEKLDKELRLAIKADAKTQRYSDAVVSLVLYEMLPNSSTLKNKLRALADARTQSER